MCQLAAYVGEREKAPLLLRSLELQEPYLGGHATGLSVVTEGEIKMKKEQGHVRHAMEVIPEINNLEGSAGIAHSRYNQRAKVDPRYNVAAMAHPFLNEDGSLAIMHNGGIRNYKELWRELREEHEFTSYVEKIDAITDSEVALHMFSDAVKWQGMDIPEALKAISVRLKGSFLFGVLSANYPDTIWIANWHQPCYIGIGDGESMFCSSKIGFRGMEEDLDLVFQPQKNSLITMTREGVDIEPLDKLRSLPDRDLNREIMKDYIYNVLEDGETDFRAIRRCINPDGWASAYGLGLKEWEQWRDKGISIVNPFIDVLDEMIEEGVINQRIDKRLEGGVRATPRYSYYV